LILGSEAHGLSKDIQSIVDQTISIEKTGFGESLNVAVAGAILMEKLS
jgi:tRNA G18 (ribose-2'-O)-methylase SpoU